MDVADGEITFLFGAVRVPWGKYHEDAVRWLQLVHGRLRRRHAGAAAGADLDGGVSADVSGAVVDRGAAGQAGAALEPAGGQVRRRAGVRGVPGDGVRSRDVGWRWASARAPGSPQYLWCVPVLVLHFAIFFSFSCMLAVWTRSTIVCVLGSLLFWFACWGMNYARHHALAEAPVQPKAEAVRATRPARRWGR